METDKTYIADVIYFSDGTTLKNATFKLFNNFIVIQEGGRKSWFNTKLIKQIINITEAD